MEFEGAANVVEVGSSRSIPFFEEGKGDWVVVLL